MLSIANFRHLRCTEPNGTDHKQEDAKLTVRTILQTDQTYTNYRIPGTVITKAGTILIYFEARRTAGDRAEFSLADLITD